MIRSRHWLIPFAILLVALAGCSAIKQKVQDKATDLIADQISTRTGLDIQSLAGDVDQLTQVTPIAEAAPGLQATIEAAQSMAATAAAQLAGLEQVAPSATPSATLAAPSGDSRPGADNTFAIPHNDWVRAVAFSPDGSLIATGSDDGSVYLWDAATGNPMGQFFYNDWVRAVAFSPDGQQLASGNDDGAAYIEDLYGNKPTLDLTFGETFVLTVAYSPDGKQLAMGGLDGRVLIYNTADGSTAKTLTGLAMVVSIAYSPDGKELAAVGDGTSIAVWNVASGRLDRTFDTGNELNMVAFSPDGRSLLITLDDGTAHLLNAANGGFIAEFAPTGWTTTAAFSPDGRQIATGDALGVVTVWDTSRGAIIHEMPGHTDWIRAVAFSPDGQRIVSAGDDGLALVFNAVTGAGPTGFDIPDLAGLGNYDDFDDYDDFDSPEKASALATRIAEMINFGTGTGGTVPGSLGDELYQLPHDDWVRAAAFSPNGDLAASGGDDYNLYLWDPTSGVLVQSIDMGDWIRSLDFSPDGKTILVGVDDSIFHLLDVTNGREVRRFVGHAGWPVNAAFSADGKKIVTSAGDGTARVWDVATGNQLQQVQVTGGEISAVAFSPNGREIATGDNSPTIAIWDAANGKKLRDFTPPGVPYSIVWDGAGRAILTATTNGTYVLDATSGDIIMAIEDDYTFTLSAVYSPDERQIATGDASGNVRLWDARTSELLALFNGHTDWVREVAFSPDGQLLLSASDDTTARLWMVPAN